VKREKKITAGLTARGEAGNGENPGRSKNRLLVVDDDASVRELLARVLQGEGYSVQTAVNGTEALDIAAAAPLDLVLLDLTMPGRNGWDTFAKLRTENPLLAVIIITARPNQFFTAVGAGVGALLEKPLDFPKLLETVSSLLAESAESRLARVAGKSAEFHYLPTLPKGKP
jgi:DNA-binding response OmpR family regulator